MSQTDDDQQTLTPAVSEDSSSSAGEKTVLDAVSAALDVTEQSPGSDESGDDDAAKAAAETQDDEDGSTEDTEQKSEDEVSEQEMGKYSPRAQDRIRSLVSSRNEIKAELEAQQAQVADLQKDADAYRGLSSFMQDNNLTADDTRDALEIAALLNTNPVEASKRLQPILTKLAEVTGNTLSDDLQAVVDIGRITEARALELSRSRAESAFAQSQREAEQQQKQTDDRASQVADLARFGDELAAKAAQSDPDWKTKESFVVDRLTSSIRKE